MALPGLEEVIADDGFNMNGRREVALIFYDSEL
jgi:hypothetical protein